jgi:hypothetical protein
MSNAQLHRLMSDYRWVYSVFNQIAGKARVRVKGIQSVLHKRGDKAAGIMTEPEEGSLKRPVTGGGLTDHAIVRYLERVKGIDIKALEDEILEKVREGESFYGGAVIVDKEGNSYVLREDGLIKSVMPHAWLSEADGIAAEQSHRIRKRVRKDDHYRQLAADGVDTTPRNPSPKTRVPKLRPSSRGAFE